MGNVAAFFDIDGTIARESLMIEHFKRLIKYEILDESVWVNDVKQLYMEYVNRYGAYDAYFVALYSVTSYFFAISSTKKSGLPETKKIKWPLAL